MKPLTLNLTLSIGQGTPKPVKRELIDAIQSIEVTHNVEGRSGFQIVFQVGRNRDLPWQDYPLAKNPLLSLFNRVIMVVTIGPVAEVLMDGMITNHQLSPSPEPGASTFTITGEDVSVMMDLDERSVSHPVQDEAMIVRRLIADYSQYGLIPKVVKPPFQDRPQKTERTPVQQGTDLAYLQEMAARFAYEFFVTPGPTAGTNIAYWGPPKRSDPQKALTLNMGSFTNVASISFQNNALAAATVKGQVQDRKTNQIQPVQDQDSDLAPLVQQTALKTQKHKRLMQFRETGRDTGQAASRAQAMVDQATEDVVTVSGELDTLLYGELLHLRGIVGLRGVGFNYDGLYEVKQVTHKIRPGDYKQSFTIKRDGTGSTVNRLKIN
jgi:hypothetical protein